MLLVEAVPDSRLHRPVQPAWWTSRCWCWSLVLGTVGLAGVGTLFAAIAAHTRAREVLLPLMLFPVQVPVILATVKSTGAAISVPGLESAGGRPVAGTARSPSTRCSSSLSVLLFDYAIEED